MNWIAVKDKLPELSYIESDNAEDPYESHPVLLYSPQKCMCVGYLCMNQNAEDWNYKELSWEIYAPENSILDVDFDKFTHWMPLPSTECIENNSYDYEL